jgi:5-methylcytosine-specific restriction protein A
LCVYLARTADKEIWAGWFLQGAGALTEDEAAGRIVQPMTERSNTQGSTGFIDVGKTHTLLLKHVNSRTPFATIEAGSVTAVVGKEPLSPFPAPKTKTPQYKQRDEEKILDSLFNEDEAPTAPPERRARVQQVRTRNLKAVKDLKALYENRCQISGDEFAFKKTNGQIYCEVHHLIPLGEGGADNPKNMIVVNPLIHRMLHYAEVTGLNLSAIKTNDAGVSTLQIQINGKSYIISWNQDHARRVLEHSP